MNKDLNVIPARVRDYSSQTAELSNQLEKCFKNIKEKTSFSNWNSPSKDAFVQANLSLQKVEDMIVEIVEGYSAKTKVYADLYDATEMSNLRGNSTFGF